MDYPYYDDYDIPEDADEALAEQCGMHEIAPNKPACYEIGTEWCSFMCPFYTPEVAKNEPDWDGLE